MADKTTLKPGYFSEKPTISSIADIKKLIGAQDACLQTNQAAVLYMIEQANTSDDNENFMNYLFSKYKISRGTNDLSYFKLTLYKSYILQTYNLVEPSFKKLNKQFKYYNDLESTWKTKDGDKNLDPLNQLVINLSREDREKLKSYPEYYLLDYYRLVRNSIVHLQEDDDEHKKTLQYYKNSLADKKDYFISTYELEAPNEPDSLSFSDFMLYTRALKYFSNILNNFCFPEMKTFAKAAFKNNELQSKLLAYKDLKSQGILLRRINTVRGHFQSHFNVHYKPLANAFTREFLALEETDYGTYLQ